MEDTMHLTEFARLIGHTTGTLPVEEVRCGVQDVLSRMMISMALRPGQTGTIF